MRAVAFALAVLCSWPLGLAQAQAPDAVSVAVSCEGLDGLAVVDAVRVELAADGIADVHAHVEIDRALAAVRVTCASAREITIHVDDLVTQKSVERALSLDDVAAGAAPRVIALAVAELLRASWAELELADPPAADPEIVRALRVRVRGLREGRRLGAPSPPPRAAPEPTPAPIPPRLPAARVELGAHFIIRAFPGGGIAPIGGGLSLDFPIAPSLRVGITADAGLGTALHPLGAVDLGLATGALSFAYEAVLETLRLSIGARAAAGAAWAQGRPGVAGVIGAGGAGFVLLLGGVLGVRWPLGDLVVLGVDVEAGGAPIGFDALIDARPVAAIAGGYLASSVGVALRL